jgi:hypothetical protein
MLKQFHYNMTERAAVKGMRQINNKSKLAVRHKGCVFGYNLGPPSVQLW